MATVIRNADSNKLAMPGLANVHTHLTATLARGIIGDGKELMKGGVALAPDDEKLLARAQHTARAA